MFESNKTEEQLNKNCDDIPQDGFTKLVPGIFFKTKWDKKNWATKNIGEKKYEHYYYF
tara:strand:+ start:1694 stop:1867 length:174 start_codon:yes stop_codon:yes gene_type:complete